MGCVSGRRDEFELALAVCGASRIISIIQKTDRQKICVDGLLLLLIIIVQYQVPLGYDT
jgi:hypothetical protein